jgi:iron complex transport system substrate-binding protein
MSRKVLFSTVMLLCIFLSACSTQAPASTPETQPISLQDGLGRTISLPGPASKVVSLAPSNSEILFAVGAGSQLVGRDSFSDYPAEVQSVASIGETYGGLDIEAIVALQPDLILAAAITPPEQVTALENAGLKVFVVPNPTDLEGMYASLSMVAELTGRQEQASQLISDLKSRVAAVEAKTASVTARPLVFYELDATDPNAVWTPGPGSFVEMLIQKAGGDNAASVLESEWAQMSLEKIIELDPEFILLGDSTWGGVTVESVAQRAGWEGLTAVKEGRVHPFDDNLVSRPGPRMVDGLEALARLLHPELFE